MATLTKLLEEHRTALSAEFKLAITSLETKLDCVQTTISDHGQRLTSLEANANQVTSSKENKMRYNIIADIQNAVVPLLLLSIGIVCKWKISVLQTTADLFFY